MNEAVTPGWCPNCMYVFDETTNVFDETILPERGDITVCLKCGIVLCYLEPGFRLASKADLAKLSPEALRNLERMQAARHQTLRRHPI